MSQTLPQTNSQSPLAVAVKTGLLLLGSVALSYNLSTLIHELGHVLAALLTGGSVQGIVIHPFSWSYAFTYSENQLLLSSGGVLLGTLFGLVIFFALKKYSKPGLLPLLLLGPLPLIQSGEYLLVDMVMQSGGDAVSLMDIGIPWWVILITGLILLVIGLIMAYSIARRTGLLAVKLPFRLFGLSIGILTYLFAVVAYAWLYKRTETGLWLVYFGSGFVLVLILALLPEIPLKIFAKLKQSATNKIGLRTVVTVDLLGLGLVAFLLMGPLSKHRGYGQYRTRPEGFPPVLTALPDVEGLSYAVADSQSWFHLAYEISKVDYRHVEIWDFITDIHKRNGYVRLAYDLADPNIPSPNNLSLQAVEVEDETPSVQACALYWLKVDGEELRLATFHVMWHEDTKEVVIVHALEMDYLADDLARYVALHPEELEPNQIRPLLTDSNH